MADARFCSLPDSLVTVLELNAWKKRRILWTVTGGLPGVADESLVKIYQAAWQVWTDVADFKAEYTEQARFADVRMGSGVIDGRGKTLAWSELPNGADTALQQKYDTSETWDFSLDPEDWRSARTPLLVTAAHEIGHALGIGHSNDKRALMYPSLNLTTRGRPQDWDIKEVIGRYGSAKPRPVPDSPPTGAAYVFFGIDPVSKKVKLPEGWRAE